jgi:phosphoglycerate kinase
MRTVRNANVTGKKILYRVDFNLPVDEDGQPSDSSRILSVIPTLEWILRHKPEQIIILTHWGRPKGKDIKWQLTPVAQQLAKILKTKQLVSSEKIITKDFKGAASPILARRYYIGRSITMLENLRFDSAEEKNSLSLAKKLAAEADLYVNDAFATCHRAHASIVAITKYLPAFAGMLLTNEIQRLEPLLAKQEKPFVVVIGGAKVADKIPIINHFRQKADAILVGGKTSADYFAALTEPVEKLIFPVDSIDAKGRITSFDKETIKKNPPFDIGPDTIVKFKSIIKSAKTVFWNGPLGVAENKKFCHGSYEIARFIANLRATTIASGGDTDAVIAKLDLHKRFSFISTGGGAASEYLIGKKLPGLIALEENAGIKPKIA